MFTWVKLIVFLAASVGIVRVSWPSLRQRQSHGFYRFFAWELIILLILSNIDYWFVAPFSLHQLLSWPLLFLSIYPVVAGLMLLKRAGQPSAARQEETLLGWEKTSQLVTTGIYGIIRHPLYCSLLIFTVGVFFKHPVWNSAILAILSILFLDATARVEEAENIAYFGQPYVDYMQKTKRFIPYIY